MKINLLAAGAFAVALAVPLGVCAQQSQPPAAYSHNRTTPSPARMQHNWARRFGRLGLSGDQQQRIQSLINQYSQTHPEGSPRDPGATHELRRQIMGVLSPDQQNQLHQQMLARRAMMQQRRAQMQQQGYPNQQYQQGYPNQQYQQGYPNQQYQQGGPYNQQYQQGPPPNQQYPQGPPQNQQYPQGPPDQQYQQGPPPDQPSGPPSA
jgi:hypothetical protein